MALLPVMQHMVLIFTHVVVFTDNFSLVSSILYTCLPISC